MFLLSICLAITLTSARVKHKTLYDDFACYQCASDEKNMGSCSVVDDKPDLLVICPRGKHYCVKKVVSRYNFVTVERGCTALEDNLAVGCMFATYEGDEEVTLCVCNTDQCNSGLQFQNALVGKILVITFVPLINFL